jgi:IS30 family transposase
MKKYKQLSYEERVQIELLKRNGVSIRGIARLLERSPNTISRELREKKVKGVSTKESTS